MWAPNPTLLSAGRKCAARFASPTAAETLEAGAQLASLEAAGEFEKAFALLPKEQKREFSGNAKAYAAFKRAQAGAVRVSSGGGSHTFRKG